MSDKKKEPGTIKQADQQIGVNSMSREPAREQGSVQRTSELNPITTKPKPK